MSEPLRIEKLRADHAVSSFDCGSEALNRFLTQFALTNQQAGAAQTYVAVSGETLVGYVVHAKDENARRFSEHFGFTASPSDPLHSFLLNPMSAVFHAGHSLQ